MAAPSPNGAVAALPNGSSTNDEYTFRNCHTYNLSWNGTRSVTRNDFIQHAYVVGIESPLAISYRFLFAALYFIIVIWCSHQYIRHGRKKRLWCDNRQIVVLSLLICSLLRGVQFLLKVVTDCNKNLKNMDELFTALETVLQFLAFVLLIAFWIELQIGMKKGLQNLHKTRNPVILFCVTFSVLRMTEFVFITLAKSPNSFPTAGISTFENAALAFRVLSMLVYTGILAVAGYWGIKLLRSLKHIENKSRDSEMPQNPRAKSKFQKSFGGADGREEEADFSTDRDGNVHSLGSSSVGEPELSAHETIDKKQCCNGNNDNKGWSVRRTMSATVRQTKSVFKRIGRSPAPSNERPGSAKTQAFRQKVVRMTLFMILEIVTVCVWLVFYGILFTMRVDGESAKVSNPTSYLILKYFEKFCEWMTIMVLCVTMIAGSRTQTAKDAASKRGGGGVHNKPLGKSTHMPHSRGSITRTSGKKSSSTRSNARHGKIRVGDGGGSRGSTSGGSHGVSSNNSRAAGSGVASSSGGANAAEATAVFVEIGVDDNRHRDLSWDNANSFNVFVENKQPEDGAEATGASKVTKASIMKKQVRGSTKLQLKNEDDGLLNNGDATKVDKLISVRKTSFPPGVQVVLNPAMKTR